MPVMKDKPAPYAPASALLELVNRHRERGLPKPVNAEVLGRAGISDSLNSRTLQALQILDLIDADGNPTSTLEGIRLAPAAEYQKRLKEWLDSAYADIIQFVDPEKDDETKIRDAFRSYNPVGMQPRMVTLFTGLYAAAGVRTETTAKTAPSRPRPASTTATPRLKAKSVPRRNAPNNTSFDGLPEPLAGLLKKLPVEGATWSQEQRDKFLTAFGHMIDFSYQIGDPESDAEEQEVAE